MSALFVSVADTAEAFGVSDDLVYALIDRGELPSTTFGRRRMIPRRAIELVAERALAGFDPARLLASLADETDTSSPALEGRSRRPGP